MLKPLARAERTSAPMDSGDVRLTRVTHNARTSGEGWAWKNAEAASSSAAKASDVNPEQS